jgi:RNA polymerase sigma-70 factor (ECF subfamily)
MGESSSLLRGGGAGDAAHPGRSRSRGYAKRGGGALKVSFDEAVVGAQERGAELIALDDALQDLAAIDPRKCQVVELRYFGGLSVDETAEVLGLMP